MENLQIIRWPVFSYYDDCDGGWEGFFGKFDWNLGSHVRSILYQLLAILGTDASNSVWYGRVKAWHDFVD